MTIDRMRRSRTTCWTLALALTVSLTGCGTIMSARRHLGVGGAASELVLGGVRADVEFQGHEGVPLWFRALLLVDLPLSLVTDTLLLPATTLFWLTEGRRVERQEAVVPTDDHHLIEFGEQDPAQAMELEGFFGCHARALPGYVHEGADSSIGPMRVDVLEGVIVLAFEGRTWELQAGDSLTIPRRSVYSIANPGPGVARWYQGIRDDR